jgi:hypothetical protein
MSTQLGIEESCASEGWRRVVSLKDIDATVRQSFTAYQAAEPQMY